MSGRVCYVARADRGSRIESLRLVGARSDDLWAVPLATPQSVEAADTELFDDRGIVAAADWVQSRTVGEKSRTGSLSLICLDAEGFSAGWITSPSTERKVVATVVASGVGSDEIGSAIGPGLGFYFPSGSEAGVQALTVAAEPEIKQVKGKPETEAPAPAGALRVPVLAGADAPVRLLLDLLDQRGIVVEGVTTIWHAMARVWGGNDSAADRNNIVTEDSGVAAIILIDPRGRLLWCWTAKGELLAGGSMRLATPVTVGRVPTPTPADAARLTNDWIAWGSQLGIVPRRVACIAADDPVGTGEDSASFHAGHFGAKLAGAWGGAGVDLVLDHDPIGATLSRLAAATADARPDETAIAGIEALSHRPGKLHRRMHAWVAMGILGGAALAAGAAWKLRSSAGELSAAARSEDARWREVVQASYPNLMKLSGDVDIEAELNKIMTRHQQERERNKIEPTRPIVQELETLSMALADPEIELESIAFSGGANASVIITVLVPDIKIGESVFKSLSSISGSNIESWQQATYSPAGAKIKGLFTGRWKNPKPGAPAPATAPVPKSAAPKPATTHSAPASSAPKPVQAVPNPAPSTPSQNPAPTHTPGAIVPQGAPTQPPVIHPDAGSAPNTAPTDPLHPAPASPVPPPANQGGAR